MPTKNTEEDVTSTQRRRAIYHGACVFLLGLFSGFPYTLVVYRDHHKEWSAQEIQALTVDTKFIFDMAMRLTGTERAWKMAHLEGLMNGTLLLILSSVLSALKLSKGEIGELVSQFAACAYLNTIASMIGATFNVRGFVFAGSVPNKITTALFGTAVVNVIRGVYLIIKGSRGS